MIDELDPCISSVKLWSNATLRMVEVKSPDEIDSDSCDSKYVTGYSVLGIDTL